MKTKMGLIFVSALFFNSSLTLASSPDCYEKLMNGFQGHDSYNHQLSSEELTEEFSDLPDLEKARMAISKLGEKLGCQSQEIQKINPNHHKESCHTFPGVAGQTVCVIERNITVGINNYYKKNVTSA